MNTSFVKCEVDDKRNRPLCHLCHLQLYYFGIGELVEDVGLLLIGHGGLDGQFLYVVLSAPFAQVGGDGDFFE